MMGPPERHPARHLYKCRAKRPARCRRLKQFGQVAGRIFVENPVSLYVMGASMGTYLTGKLSEFLATRAMVEAGAPAMTEAFCAVGLHDAMYVIPALAFVCALVLFAASRTVSADMVVKRA